MTYIKSDLIYILRHFYLVISRAFDPKENSKKYPYTYYKDEDSRRYSEEREVRNNHLHCIWKLVITAETRNSYFILYNKRKLYLIMGGILNNRSYAKGLPSKCRVFV